MTTQVLLDTNTYLRLAKRVRPAVGREFGQVPYVLVILKAVELLLGTVQLDLAKYTTGRSPPGATDCWLLVAGCWLLVAGCWLLAYGQVKGAIVVTDDLGMHTLAADVGLKVWHGFELLAKLRTAKIVDNDLVRQIYDALERNNDTTDTWREAKHREFSRIFGIKE